MSRWAAVLFLVLPALVYSQKNQGVYPAGKILEGKELSANLAIYHADRLNSEQSDYSPAFYADGLVFVSGRQSQGPRAAEKGQAFFKLYYAAIDGNGLPMAPSLYSLRMNSRKHEGPAAFLERKGEAYFSRSAPRNSPRIGGDDTLDLHIYSAKWKMRDWRDIRAVSINGKDYSCMHPALSPGGDTLYFISDMEGGSGGYDLYMAERTSDRIWGDPVNLGPEINSPGKEGFPFVHPNGLLFFASDPEGGMGGLDIYMADLQLDSPKVMPLAPPLNSSFDDFGLIIREDGVRGYFSTNRPGGFGQDDIYMVETAAVSGASFSSPLAPLEKLVYVSDAETGESLEAASIYLLPWEVSGEKGLRQLYEMALVPASDTSDEMLLQSVIKPDADLGEPIATTDDRGRAVIEGQIGEDDLLVVRRRGYLDHKQQISFPDPGSVDPTHYLLVNLIPDDCIRLNGLAINAQNSQPIPNAVVSLMTDCESGEEEVVKSNELGQFEACLQYDCTYQLQGKRHGYQMFSSTLPAAHIPGSGEMSFRMGMIPRQDQMGTFLEHAEVREGAVFVIDDISYDYNDAAIKEKEASSLVALADLMQQYPQMVVELAAHTDTRGGTEYNALLSLRRAEAAKELLVSLGVEPVRIYAVGHGESRPRNRCRDGVECTEQEHAYNRRTEVTIKKLGPHR